MRGAQRHALARHLRRAVEAPVAASATARRQVEARAIAERTHRVHAAIALRRGRRHSPPEGRRARRLLHAAAGQAAAQVAARWRRLGSAETLRPGDPAGQVSYPLSTVLYLKSSYCLYCTVLYCTFLQYEYSIITKLYCTIHTRTSAQPFNILGFSQCAHFGWKGRQFKPAWASSPVHYKDFVLFCSRFFTAQFSGLLYSTEPTHLDMHKSRTLARRVAELQTLRWSPASATESATSPGGSCEPETYASPLEFLREFRRLQQLRNVPASALFGASNLQPPGALDSAAAPAFLDVGADEPEREMLRALSEPPPNSAQSGSSGGGRSAEGSAADAERPHQPEPEVLGANGDDEFDRSFTGRTGTGFLPPIEGGGGGGGAAEQTSSSLVRAMAARASAQLIATARSEISASDAPPRSARPASRGSGSASGALAGILNVTIALSPNSSRRQSHRSPTPSAAKALLGGSSRASPVPVPGASGPSARASLALLPSPSPHAPSPNGLIPSPAARRSSQNVRSPAASSVRSHRASSPSEQPPVDRVHSPPASRTSRHSTRAEGATSSSQTKRSTRSSATESPAKAAGAAAADHQSSVVSVLLVPHFNSDLTEAAVAALSLSKRPDPKEEL